MKSPTDLPTLCKWKVQKHKDLHKETLDKHHPAASVVDLPSEFSLAGPLEGTCDTEKMSQQSMSWQIMRCKVQALTCKELHKNALQHFLIIIGPLALSWLQWNVAVRKIHSLHSTQTAWKNKFLSCGNSYDIKLRGDYTAVRSVRPVSIPSDLNWIKQGS